MVSIFVSQTESKLTELYGKAFSQIKVIAKKFQTAYPAITYLQAMEKTVNGFKDIHTNRKNKEIPPTEW